MKILTEEKNVEFGKSGLVFLCTVKTFFPIFNLFIYFFFLRVGRERATETFLGLMSPLQQIIMSLTLIDLLTTIMPMMLLLLVERGHC